MNVIIVGNKGHGKYGRETIGQMGMGNTRIEGVQEVQGKDQSTQQPTFVCQRTTIHHRHHRPGINPPSLPTQRHQTVPHPPQALHHKREVPLALEKELTHSPVSYRTTSRQQRFWLVFLTCLHFYHCNCTRHSHGKAYNSWHSVHHWEYQSALTLHTDCMRLKVCHLMYVPSGSDHCISRKTIKIKIKKLHVFTSVFCFAKKECK